MKKKAAPPETTAGTRLIDSHCHLDMDTYQDDLDTVVASAAASGVDTIITIGIDLASSRRAVALTRKYSGVFATVGIHPHDAVEGCDQVYQQLRELSKDTKVVGYGEIGLDYAKNYAPKEVQLRTFAAQLELVRELRLPVVIHDREAHTDTLGLLREKGPFTAGGVMHCFSGDTDLARQVLEIGFHLSIPGVVTFKNANALRDVVREIPLEHLLIETDGPFLAPVPWRGKRNRPDLLLYTADKIAEIKGITIEEVAHQTRQNTMALFSLNALDADRVAS